MAGTTPERADSIGVRSDVRPSAMRGPRWAGGGPEVGENGGARLRGGRTTRPAGSSESAYPTQDIRPSVLIGRTSNAPSPMLPRVALAAHPVPDVPVPDRRACGPATDAAAH